MATLQADDAGSMAPDMKRTLVPAARAAASLLLVALFAAGCATPEPPKPAPAPPPPAPVAPPPEPAKPVAPPEPQLTPAQARAQAQKLTVEAITQLQNGDEASATKTLEEVLKLDPASVLG